MNDLEDQVQVSRMMSLPFRGIRIVPVEQQSHQCQMLVRMVPLPSQVMCVVPAEALATSVPNDSTHSHSSSCVTAGALCIDTHSIASDANSSLPPPRHRCYGLLSPGLSLLVRKSQCNSYLARQDGLW
jgi:hypothetical protein